MKLVTEKAGKPVTNSLKVSDVFDKRHDNVLQSIETIQDTLNSIGRGPLNFQETNYLDKQGKERPMYDMDRDAFAVLVFGFTGEKALGFKVDFIKAFNEMELELMKARAELIDPSNIPKALRLLAASIEGCPVQETKKQPEETKCILSFPNQAKACAKVSVTKGPKNMETNSVQRQFSLLGLRPTVTTNHLVKKGYLKVVPKPYEKCRTRKEPTNLGKQYFLAYGNGLYLLDDGLAFVKNEISAGRIPDYCFKKIAA